MSHTHTTAASSSNFQLIFSNALDAYEKRTKNNLLAHPLAAQLQACDSPRAILAVLQQQVQGLDQSRSSDGRWSKWLDPTVNVLYAFSTTLEASVSLLFSPASVIFAGVGVLFSAVNASRASQDALVDIFEHIGMLLRRFEVYIELQPTTEMMDIVIQIMVEVLSILGIATKEIKQGRIKKYAKKLMGRTDMEDTLKRLDKLTHEGARMATAESRIAIDNKVAGFRGRVRVGDGKVAEVIRDGKEKKVAIQQTATHLNQAKRNQLRENIHEWLSPPDPSTNHNIARSIHYEKTASWFVQGNIFQEWKSTSPLLWIHGKPGSGKSILCSTVIQDIEAMSKAGQASMAYFYFDFRDANKQGLGNLVSSLLTQLSASSGPRCDILSDLFSAYDKDKTQPSDSDLAECLKEMLTLPDQLPTYLIIDALDESRKASGIPSSRERVLQLMKELVELHHTDLHICITSRPEMDIRDVLEPLTSCRVSLHDESGQKKDIEDYVKSIVYSNSEPIMKRWRIEDKELVVKALSERADGMFRWVFCQLETLRRCFPPSVRHTLYELPESLDETYERALKEIKKPNREHAHRLMQCLVAAIRPLRVEELAEVLAVDFSDKGGIPILNPNWRWEDQEQAILTSCSSLIAIVQPNESRVVQFSHFSVKEFLTSDRLATSDEFISRYHIIPEPAHTVLAQACLGVLLQLEDRIKQCGIRNRSPLATYAAEHWVTHARGERQNIVASSLQRAMEYLFDQDKPYFAAWLQLHDIDTATLDGTTFHQFTPYSKSGSTPLYYAALCGFRDLVEHLIVNDSIHIHTRGGYYLTPLVAALAGGHMQIAQFLRDNGADPNVRGRIGMTPLHSAAFYGEFEMVQVLLKFEADANARDAYGRTPLHLGLEDFYSGNPDFDVVTLLLEHGADINARRNDHATPLHLAVQFGRIDVVRMLLEHGADIGARDSCGRTAFRVASQNRRDEIMKLLTEYGYQNMGSR